MILMKIIIDSLSTILMRIMIMKMINTVSIMPTLITTSNDSIFKILIAMNRWIHSPYSEYMRKIGLCHIRRKKKLFQIPLLPSYPLQEFRRRRRQQGRWPEMKDTGRYATSVGGRSFCFCLSVDFPSWGVVFSADSLSWESAEETTTWEGESVEETTP